ncbi:MAG: DUF6754 domain-containing protein [Candidatus Edwardsbacteria bacterium]
MRKTILCLTVGILGIANFCSAEELPKSSIAPPTEVKAFDTPNDGGKEISIEWKLSPDDSIIEGYEIYRREEGGVFEKIGFVGRSVCSFADQTKDRVKYYYYVATLCDSIRVQSETTGPIKSFPQWVDKKKINIFVALIVFGGLVLLFISHARRGKPLFIRKIAGLQAVDDAVGRATEMGKPVLYCLGTGDIDYIATIASLNILGAVAKKIAQYDTPLIVPNYYPVVYTVAREIVKESYTVVGRPDAFDADSVFFVTDSQFAYAAAVDGMMLRDRPATNFLIGTFAAEALILAETGASTGAIQIAGTDSVAQLPFFFTACDYTLIGEELYAASAYLSKEPLLLGAIKGEDWGKIIIIVVLTTASVLGLLTKFPILGLFK